MTLRQVYYQMVARDIIPNSECSYKILSSLIFDARLASMVDWFAIEDRTRNLRRNSHWTTPGSMNDSAAWSYHLDHWLGQKNYVEVRVEKDAMISIVGQISGELGVSHFFCRRYCHNVKCGARPSGWGSTKSRDSGLFCFTLATTGYEPDIQKRLAMFDGELKIQFHRLALNYDQIERYAPPPNLTKLSDSRANGFIEKYGYECWELDALEPRVIRDLIRENVLKYRSERVLKQEESEKALLEDLSKKWGGVADHWAEIKRQYCRG